MSATDRWEVTPPKEASAQPPPRAEVAVREGWGQSKVRVLEPVSVRARVMERVMERAKAPGWVWVPV